MKRKAETMKNKPAQRSSVQFPLRYRVFELTAAGTAVGKSLTAIFLAALLRMAGYSVCLVRIESRAANRQGADLMVDAEDFSQSARLPGASAAVLRPLFLALQQAAGSENSIVIIDWGGGLTSYRNEAFTATRFDERLAAWGMRGLSIVPTTSAVDRMEQAAEVLAKTALVVPGMDRLLILNRRLADFSFVTGSADRRAYEKLRAASEGIPTIEIPAVAGESLKTCEDAGLAMRDVIAADVAQLARQLGEIEPIAAAIQSHIAAWWAASERQLMNIIRAPDEK
jgi:hypothetical protein